MMYGSESFPKEAFKNWQLVEKLPYVIGDFVWTGLDYIGESGIGHSLITDDPEERGSFLMPWPWYVSWCGDLDITGQKKPQSYYRDVVWGESKLELGVHEPLPAGYQEKTSIWGWPLERMHWNWDVEQGTPLQVNVYSSYPSVRLAMNGRVIGEQEVNASNLTATFEVPFEKGELRATGISHGTEMESKSLKTTGNVTGLKLVPERSVISANRGEVAYIKLMAIDQDERLVPEADFPVSFRVDGEGELLAAGNGSPLIQGSLQDETCNLFRGKALVVIRSNGKKGQISLSASGINEGIQAMTTITVE
jgi:beta-galactosidase